MSDNFAADKLVEARGLTKYFKTKQGLLHAVDGIDFSIFRGETLGLVGESGCGKSTTGRLLIRLLEVTAGEIIFDGIDILKLKPAQLRSMREKMQIVFQDPFASLNPRMSVSEIIAEPLIINKKYSNRRDVFQRVRQLMDTVGLSLRFQNSYPHELDGGRRQRIGIARALSLNPSFIVQDEPVSALDVSIQAQILNLMQDLQEEYKLTYLFISHDLGVIKHVSNRIVVMYLGKIVEMSDYKTMFSDPRHPYTKALLSAIPIPTVDEAPEQIILEGDVTSPINPPRICRFYSRCYAKIDICAKVEPELVEFQTGRFCACHLTGQDKQADG